MRADIDPLGKRPPTDEYLRLVGEVTVLRKKNVKIGMAVILAGGVDRATCAEVRLAIGKLADYISYAEWGPLVVVAFQRCLFEQLKPMWQELLAGAPAACAGVAFPGPSTDTSELVLGARLALKRALDAGYDMVAFDEDEAKRAVAEFRDSCAAVRARPMGGEPAPAMAAA